MSDVRWVLQRFDKVRESGKDQWIACCPAHDDKSPSLSIRDTDEKILIHCFAGCDVNTILGSVGLEITDIFHTQRVRPMPDREAEELVLEIAKAMRASGERLTEADKARELKALLRLRGARA